MTISTFNRFFINFKLFTCLSQMIRFQLATTTIFKTAIRIWTSNSVKTEMFSSLFRDNLSLIIFFLVINYSSLKCKSMTTETFLKWIILFYHFLHMKLIYFFLLFVCQVSIIIYWWDLFIALRSLTKSLIFIFNLINCIFYKTVFMKLMHAVI